MNPLAYSTADYREELTRVRKARRRNTAIVIIVDVAVILLVAVLLLKGFVLQ